MKKDRLCIAFYLGRMYLNFIERRPFDLKIGGERGFFERWSPIRGVEFYGELERSKGGERETGKLVST